VATVCWGLSNEIAKAQRRVLIDAARRNFYVIAVERPEDLSPARPDLPPAAFKIFSRRSSISNVMLQLAATANETVTVRDLLNHFGERALGALLLVFAIPNALPMPPGVSFLMGAPLIFISFQLMIGRPNLWLPKAITNRGVPKATFIAMSLKVLPTLRRLELVVKPRYQGMFNPIGDRLVGAMTLILALVIFLPIPLGNMLPSLAMIAFGFGLVEFDGAAVLVGWLIAAASLAILALLSNSIIQGVTGLIAMFV
jgi:hypothetical protein